MARAKTRTALDYLSADEVTEELEETGVEDVGLVIEKWGQDCDDLQQQRELLINSIQSGAGEVSFEIHRGASEVYGASKLCVVDNGSGMSHADMAQYINKIASSARQQATNKNLGLGAKIAAASRNPLGLIYLSWVDGVGAMIHMRRRRDGKWGLRKRRLAGGTLTSLLEVPDGWKPKLIGEHGTCVILLGRTPKHDTASPWDRSLGRTKWLPKYLNSRFVDLPSDVRIHAVENHDSKKEGNRSRRRIRGQRYFLDRLSTAKTRGTVSLNTADVHWWVLTVDGSKRSSESPHSMASFHVATVMDGEIYEVRQQKPAISVLQSFGIHFNYDRVVLYIEPHASLGAVFNGARSRLLLVNKRGDSKDLPWDEWAEEFRANMPPAIIKLMDEVAAAKADEDFSKSIDRRLGEVLHEIGVPRYRRDRRGDTRIADGGAAGAAVNIRDGERRLSKGKTRRTRSGSTMLHDADPNGARTGRKVIGMPDRPRWEWICLADGTRVAGDLEDRAARYLPAENVLLINGDFRATTSMTSYWVDRYVKSGTNHSIAEKIVKGVIREWVTLSLVEVIVGVQALRDNTDWDDLLKIATSEEALTSAVFASRWHVHRRAANSLSHKLGKLTDQPAAGSSTRKAA